MICIAFVFCAATASPAQTFTNLVNFNGTNGAKPLASLLQAADGNFYGTTSEGGASRNCLFGCGTVFKLTAQGTLTTLHSFDFTDGAFPAAGLIQATDGNFYGTTEAGTASNNHCLNGCGTVFKITPAGALNILHNFNGTDGSEPIGSLVQAGDGNFYGTTAGGGGVGNGTVFKITPAGTLTTLLSFNGADGYSPNGSLVQGTDGNFYGTTEFGGPTACLICGPNFANGCPSGCGTVFKITPGGTLTMLHSFNGADGAHPYFAGLVQATDGNFYGTTYDGGGTPQSAGTVFRITPGGTLTTLYTFYTSGPSEPAAGLVRASDGNFYGTTFNTIFEITAGGMLTTLHSFNGTDGGSPNGSLVQASDGNFYGTTKLGGANGNGTVFRVGPAAAPSITSGGIVPVDSAVNTIQPGEWVSIYGTNLASSMVSWNGDFPTTLGGTSVTINGKAAYLSYVSPSQINLQAPNDTTTGPVPVVVTATGGIATSTVTLAPFAPSFLLLDSKHVAGLILRSDGSGAYGGGTYDIVGPTGTSLGYPTVAAKPGDIIELFGTGFGPTSPAIPAGQTFSGAAPTTNPVSIVINNVNVTPIFAGLSDAGLYQINVMVPAGVGTGDVSLVGTVGGARTPTSVVISLQ